ncbi:MAG: cytidylate kinase-like family protein [Proteobacteria bacterium]|nr:cytidylate kinase-like family protein [Pseudomonadota bacterium]
MSWNLYLPIAGHSLNIFLPLGLGATVGFLSGLTGVGGVSHVLKVRIQADMEDRVALAMETEHLTEEQARDRLHKDDNARKQWSLRLYGVDTSDSSLYDLVIHLHKLKVDDAVNLIRETAQLDQFKSTPESQQVLDDLLLAARVRASLVGDYPMVQAHAENGVVTVDAKINITTSPELAGRIRELAIQTSGVKDVRIHTLPVSPYFHSDCCEKN